MHDCQKFREELTDLILGGEPAPGMDPGDCTECQRFHEDALAVVKILDSVEVSPPDLSEEYWDEFGSRLRSSLIAQQRPPASPRGRMLRSAALATAAVVVLTLSLGIFRTMSPLIEGYQPASPATQVRVEDEHAAGLDPGTVNYLSQSELFLRSFVKIEPTDTEDLADARSRARLQLAGLNQRRAAVSGFPPVEGTLDEYETILHDIRNVEEPSDLADIQDRISRNGLIASMKAFQPRVVLVNEQ